MSTLHTVNKSPFEKTSLDACLATPAAAPVLLIEDGVYAATKGTSVEQVKQALDSVKGLRAGPGPQARGLSEERVIDGISVVDYAGFVDLAAENDKVQAWL
jgi:tRNA 2-thiouridine synthesizing protein B